MNPIQAEGTAVITGASSGVGAVYADHEAAYPPLALVSKIEERPT